MTDTTAHHHHGKRPKEEKLPASDEISEVAPGILRLQLPISLPGLGHVNCYAIEDPTGFALVDPGLPGPTSWRHLKNKMKLAGFGVSNVHTVIVTHSHPDHFGQAGKLAAEANADIVTHESFRLFSLPDPEGSEDSGDLETNADTTQDQRDADASPSKNPWDGETPWGGPRPSPPFRRRVAFRMARRWFRALTPTTRLIDAEVIEIGGRPWVSVHTPGHTADHLCLHDPTNGILLAGDHVLPTITPHISGMAGDDSLADYLTSLDKVDALGNVTTVLPAHGHPFVGLGARVSEIKDHHLERLDQLVEAGADLPGGSVGDYMQVLFRKRSWGPMAESETYAHLEHLRSDGRATRTEQAGKLHYTIR